LNDRNPQAGENSTDIAIRNRIAVIQFEFCARAKYWPIDVR
jgi:hypothetical protein